MNQLSKEALAKKIRRLRESAGKSQGELGLVLGKSHASVSDIERGITELTVKDLTIIADFLGVERTTIWRTRKRYLEEGLESTLQEKERSGQPRKYGPQQEAEVIALACSAAPEGRARWSLELLTEKLRQQK